MSWGPLILSFKLALLTTLILLLIATPIAYWLSRSKSKFKPVVQAIVSLPLVLPPTVIGLYFLLAFSPNNAFGAWLNDWFGIRLVFTFPGLVIASIIYSLPFMVQPIHAGLAELPSSLTEASYVLGKSKWATLRKVLIPNIKGSLLIGAVLTFAHTIGEFGIVYMIGGSRPDITQVASIAIYDEVEASNYDMANQYALILIGIMFTILLFVYLLNGGYLKRFRR